MLVTMFAFAGIVSAQETAVITTSEQVVVPATAVATQPVTTGVKAPGQEVKEIEMQIKALNQEMEAKIKALRAEYKVKVDALRKEVKVRMEAVRQAEKVRKEAEKVKAKEVRANTEKARKASQQAVPTNTAPTTTQ